VYACVAPHAHSTTLSSHLISSRLISSRRVSSGVFSLRLVSSDLVCRRCWRASTRLSTRRPRPSSITPRRPRAPSQVPSHLISSHPIPSHRIASHLICSHALAPPPQSRCASPVAPRASRDAESTLTATDRSISRSRRGGPSSGRRWRPTSSNPSHLIPCRPLSLG
jgi:hypothetical protein